MTIRTFLFGLDERLEVWTAVSVSAATIYWVDLYLQVMALGFCLILCLACGAKCFVAGFIIVLCIMAAISRVSARLFPGAGRFTGLGVIYISIKFGPLLAMMFFVQASLNTSRFLRSLEIMRVPPQWVAPLWACLRFMPSVAAECRQIRQAMRSRGIAPIPGRLLLQPLETLSYTMVLLLVRSLRIGDELARAAVARGFQAPGAKTSLHEIGLRPCDILFAALWTLGPAAMLMVDHLALAASSGGPT